MIDDDDDDDDDDDWDDSLARAFADVVVIIDEND